MPKDDIPRRIVDYLKKQEWPSTTEDIAAGCKISWNTAQVWLLKLMADNKVKYRKVGRQNQWWIVKDYRKNF